MAGEDRTTPHAVDIIGALRKEPYKFGFFQAMRRLENLYRDRPRIGESARPSDDPVRFGQEPHLTFAPSTLASYERGANGAPDRLRGYFFGLFGPNGPLPLHLTEHARARVRDKGDRTFIGFADTFHHRMLSLFYRAWAAAQPAVSFDRPEADRFSLYVGSLCGLGMASLRGRDAMPDLAKLHFSGRLALQTRNAEGLKAIVEGFFRMPVSVEEFVGEWLELPGHQLCRLGESTATGALGVNTTLGGRVWSRQYRFTLVFGPMVLADYRRLLPGGDSLKRLVAIVRNYVGDELSWNVKLILKKPEVPPIRLGTSGRLGWTTWLMPRPSAEDAGDLVFEPMRAAL